MKSQKTQIDDERASKEWKKLRKLWNCLMVLLLLTFNVKRYGGIINVWRME